MSTNKQHVVTRIAYCVGAGLSTEIKRDSATDDGNEEEERKIAAAMQHASE